MASIGVHVYGGNPNSASCIGLRGNPFLPYISTFTQKDLTKINAPQGILDVPSFMEFYTVMSTKTEEGLFGDITEDEGLFSIIGSALSIGADVVGAIGGPVGALAGVGIQAIVNLASGPKAESAGLEGEGLLASGIIERGLIQDCAFHAIYNMDPKSRQRLGIEEGMLEVTKSLWPKVRKFAPVLLNVITAPALNVATSTAQKEADKQKRAEESIMMPERQPIKIAGGATKSIADPDISPAFIEALLQPTLDTGDTEGFFDNKLGSILDKGLRIAKPIIEKFADAGLDVIVNQLQQLKGGLRQQTPEALNGAAQRAIMGAAALQALQKIDPKKLDEEGIFGTMIGGILKYGPTVLQQAPDVIKGVVNVVDQLKKASVPGPPSERNATDHSQVMAIGSLQVMATGPFQDDGPFFVSPTQVPR